MIIEQLEPRTYAYASVVDVAAILRAVQPTVPRQSVISVAMRSVVSLLRVSKTPAPTPIIAQPDPVVIATVIPAPRPRVRHPSTDLFNAIAIVESGGNVNAVGDGGAALGIVQIHPAVVADVNRIYHTHYTLADRADEDKSYDIWYKYLTYWGQRYSSHFGVAPSDQVFARIWNGGPMGWAKDSTAAYWTRVDAILNPQ